MVKLIGLVDRLQDDKGATAAAVGTAGSEGDSGAEGRLETLKALPQLTAVLADEKALDHHFRAVVWGRILTPVQVKFAFSANSRFCKVSGNLRYRTSYAWYLVRDARSPLLGSRAGSHPHTCAGDTVRHLPDSDFVLMYENKFDSSTASLFFRTLDCRSQKQSTCRRL